MPNARISATWLSDEMAYALAAMWPPLEATDVMRAADKLTTHTGPPAAVVHLVRQNEAEVDEVLAQGVLEALQALRDLAA